MSRRIVMLGRKKAEFHTQTWWIDNNRPAVVEAAGLPAWSPKAPEFTEPDYDLLRKQRLEGEEEL